MQPINASIVGGAGYTGGELLRILLQHPVVTVNSVVSTSQAGNKISDFFTDLTGETDLVFTSVVDKKTDVVFLCLPHGESKQYLLKHPELASKKIIDLSRDFRLESDAIFNNKKFVYGLPELYRSEIVQADYIANPGCFATAIQLGLLPLAKQHELDKIVYVSAITGSTGAGQKPSDTTHYSWRHSNVSAYQLFNHPHVDEINQSLNHLQNSYHEQLVFVPQRGSFTRGIMATTMLQTRLSENEVLELYTDFYKEAAFTFVTNKAVDLKMVVNTNKCFIQLSKHKDQLVIISVIDNLLKGAAGQAVQNMNLMFGLEEKTALQLKCLTF